MVDFSHLPAAVSDENGVQHYGSPLREQRSLERGQAVAELGDRAVLALTGPDRLSWLDTITSQAVAHLPVGISSELLVLDPQGRVEHAAGIVDDGETTWLILDRADRDPLAAWLLRMRFRMQVDITPRDDLRVLGAIVGGPAAELISDGAAAVWRDPWTGVTRGGWQYAQVTEHPGADRDWIEAVVTVARAAEVASDIAASSTVSAAGLLSSEALRIAAWRPRWSHERDDRLIPHEVDWLRSAVHLDKGCYRGQETVAKVHNLGHPPRRLVMLHLDGSDSVLPEPGTAVLVEEDTVGTITSAAMHHELGPVALALLNRRVPADTVLTVDAGEPRISAAQQVIVPADAGSTANVPRLTRLSRRPLKTD